MNYEHLDCRILGAVSFQDATTNLRIRHPLTVEVAAGVKLVRNRSGYYVIFSAPGFNAYVDSFSEQPIEPDPRAIQTETMALELRILDLHRKYLPRRSTVHLPLNPAITRPSQGGWLFDPIEVKLFSAPTANTLPGWAAIRATVREEGKQNRLPWALITVRRNGKPEPLARGLADHRGEAFVPVPGLPVTIADEGPGAVMTSEIPVALEVIFDTSLQKVPNGVAPDRPDNFFPDPAVLEAGTAPRFRSSTKNDSLASGREYRMELTVNLS